MNINVQARPIGAPFENKKKTGFMQKCVLQDKEGRLLSSHLIFSQKLETFTPNNDGLLQIPCEVPEFLMAARV